MKKHYKDQLKPIITGGNIHYEMGEKTRAMSYGGMGTIHKMVKQIGLDKEIDNHLELLTCQLHKLSAPERFRSMKSGIFGTKRHVA